MKKFLSAISLIMALLCFASCTAGSGSGDSTVWETETQAPESNLFAPLSEPVLIVNANQTIYTLVRPDRATDEIVECFRIINRAVENVTGKAMQGKTDWVKDGVDMSAAYELLVGNTCRPESRTVMEEIGYDEYAIVTINNKIVIAAHTEKRLTEAVNYFVKNLLSFEGEGSECRVYLKDSYRYDNPKNYVFTKDNTLDGYRVVCAAGNSDAMATAQLFVNKIKKVYGIDLPIVTDAEPAVEKEIVLGNCSREIAKEGLKGTSASEYVVFTQGKSVLIASTSDYFTKIGVEKFCTESINQYYSYTPNFLADTQKRDSSYAFSDPSKLVEGSDIRIMSFNILCEKWNDKLPVEGRDYAVAACIKYFAPDVIGLQEMSDNWYSNLGKLISDEYVFTDPKTTEGKTNFSTLAYNKNKVKMISHGVQLFSQGNNTQLRLVTWGLFETLDTGKQFIAMTTHWDLGSNPQYQQVHSDEMAQIALQLQSKYNVPVITTGDYNTTETTSYYSNFLKKSGFHDAKTTAAVIKRGCKTYHDVGTTPSSATGNAIDHIFGSDDVQFMLFNVVLDKAVIDASDHCPIYADIKLK